MRLFVNSVNVKGQCKYFFDTIFNHKLLHNASFNISFFERYLKVCLSVRLFVNSVNVKGQCKYFFDTIFNHKLLHNASFNISFYQSKQQTTDYLCRSLKVRSRSNRHNQKLLYFVYLIFIFIRISIFCLELKLNLYVIHLSRQP